MSADTVNTIGAWFFGGLVVWASVMTLAAIDERDELEYARIFGIILVPFVAILIAGIVI